MNIEVFDTRRCQLGEGPLWHPTRKQLFWCDITGKRLLTRDAQGAQDWPWDQEISAAGWVDENHLLVASAVGLWKFDLRDGMRTLMCPLESETSLTRSNDGRADPWGGFWIGTMGRNAEPGAGAIYRYFQGQLKRLVSDITISNAICFAPDRSTACYTDTATSKIMRVPLDRSGWPSGKPSVYIDLSAEGLHPDGAIFDSTGTLWVAQWGAGRVAAYINGAFERSVEFPANHITCPAFGGADLTTLFATSAMQGIAQRDLDANVEHGQTFAASGVAKGLAEPKVLL